MQVNGRRLRAHPMMIPHRWVYETEAQKPIRNPRHLTGYCCRVWGPILYCRVLGPIPHWCRVSGAIPYCCRVSGPIPYCRVWGPILYCRVLGPIPYWCRVWGLIPYCCRVLGPIPYCCRVSGPIPYCCRVLGPILWVRSRSSGGVRCGHTAVSRVADLRPVRYSIDPRSGKVRHPHTVHTAVSRVADLNPVHCSIAPRSGGVRRPDSPRAGRAGRRQRPVLYGTRLRRPVHLHAQRP